MLKKISSQANKYEAIKMYNARFKKDFKAGSIKKEKHGQKPFECNALMQKFYQKIHKEDLNVLELPQIQFNLG
jgi:hypothetical protein